MVVSWKKFIILVLSIFISVFFISLFENQSRVLAFHSTNVDISTILPINKIGSVNRNISLNRLGIAYSTTQHVIVDNLARPKLNSSLNNYLDTQYNYQFTYPLDWKIKYTNYTGYLETVSFYYQDQETLVVYVWENNSQKNSYGINGLITAYRNSLPGDQNPTQEIIQFSKGDFAYEMQFFPKQDNLGILDNLLASFHFNDDLSSLNVISAAELLNPTEPQSVNPQCSGVTKSGWPSYGSIIFPAGNWNGVDVFSNGGDLNNACPGTYGLEFQCVELAQRFFAQWGFPSNWHVNAWQMFNDTNVTGATSYTNGSSTPPVWGDLLVFRDLPNGIGHVAVVTGVSNLKITFVEQNWSRLGQASLDITSSNNISSRLSNNTSYTVLGWVHADKNTIGNGGAPNGYVFCTNETGYCGFSGTATIAFGAQGNYTYKNLSNGTDCTTSIFGDPVPGIQKSCYINGGGPIGYTYCASENQHCSFSGVANIAYGASLKYIYKDNISSGIDCNTSTFGGDPISGIAKACYYKSQGQIQGTWTANYYAGHTRWWDNSNTSNWQCSESINPSTYTLNKDYGSGAPCNNGMSGDNWVGDYKATINFPSNNYVFWIDHDDGLKLWLNGTNIADVGDSGSYWVCPARYLNGNQNLWAMLREDGGSAHIIINWSTDTSICDPPFAFSKNMPYRWSMGISTNPTISWNSSTKANWYEYCIDTIDNNICDTNWVNVQNVTSTVINGLSNGTTYYWQVRAGNPYSLPTEADGGTWWSFTTQPGLPGNFNKISPLNGSTGQLTNPTLIWGASAGASEYEYCYDTLNNNICDGNWVDVGNLTQANLSGLAGGITYYWQVRATNSAGTTYSNASTTAFWSFTTLPAPSSHKTFLTLVMNRYASPVTLSIPIHADNLDSYEDATTFKLSGDGNNNDWVGSSSAVITGWIFTNVQIPKGAMITNSYVKFRGFGNGDATPRFSGFAEDNSAPFAVNGSNKTGLRPITTHVVDWSNNFPFSWSLFQTPDLSPFIQEIINRPGWMSGNSIGIKASNPSGTGANWCVVDYAGGSGHNVTLYITYAMP